MLRDGAIVHNDPVTFWNWQFDSEVLNVAVLAILAPVLAYQLTAICFNVILGMKERGTASACDIHKLVLAECATPLQIFAAVVRHDAVDYLRLRGDHPRSVKIGRSGTSVGTKSILSLILLVMTGPMFSLASMFIVFPHDEKLSFNDAKFGGVALGLGVDNITYHNYVLDCDLIPLWLLGSASTDVRFSLCYEFDLRLDKNFTGEEIKLSAETTFQGQIKVSVISLPSKIPTSMALHVDMTNGEELFRVQPVLTLRDAAEMVHDGQKRLNKYCDLAKQENFNQDERFLDIKDSDGVLMASKVFRCSHSKTNITGFIDVFKQMANRTSLIEHDTMNVVNVNNIPTEADSLPKYFTAGRMPFLVRRGRNVNVLPLLLLTFLSLILRILTEWAFNNDLEEAVEAIVRDRLGAEPEEQLLRSSRIVTYTCNCQDSRRASCRVSSLKLQDIKQSDNRGDVVWE